MSTAPPRTAEPVLRRTGGIAGWIGDHLFGILAAGLELLRGPLPLLQIGKTCFVTRYDDVREVLANDAAFPVQYKATLDVVTGREPFVLGIADAAAVRAETALMREVMRADDIAGLGQRAAAAASAIVAASGGRLDVVDGLVRPVSFDVLIAYLGLTTLPRAELRIWATRLFAFVFFGGDAALGRDAATMAPLLRARIDAEIARVRAAADATDDSVLARCLRRQAAGDARFSDTWIRTTMVGMIVGGPPQPPIVLPSALDELLRRPAALASAQAAARTGDQARVYGHIREALRFHPLAPVIRRVAVADTCVALGTWRARRIKAGTGLLVGVRPAMHDPRRIEAPAGFDPDRLDYSFLHYGFGAHECFARHINAVFLPAMLMPLLQRPGLARAAGAAGQLRMNGAFADRLEVTFDRAATAAGAPADSR